MDMPVPKPNQGDGISLLLWIVVLLLGSVGTQTATMVRHYPGTDLQQEAFLLAQQTEQQRRLQPFGNTYANAWCAAHLRIKRKEGINDV